MTDCIPLTAISHSETRYWIRRCRPRRGPGSLRDNASSIGRYTKTSRLFGLALRLPAPADHSCPAAPEDCALRLVMQAWRSNRGDTNQRTTAIRCRPHRTIRIRLGERPSPGRLRRSHRHRCCLKGTGPARCSPPTYRRASSHCPTHNDCDRVPRETRTRIRLRLGVAFTPPKPTPRRLTRRSEKRDNCRGPRYCYSDRRALSNSRPARNATTAKDHQAQRSARVK